MRALLLAAGAGTRLRPFTDDRPKPMVEVDGEPALAHILRWLRAEGVSELAINLHHHPQVLQDFVGDGSAFGIRVHYSLEETPLGTSGALVPLRGFFSTEPLFIIAYGDVLTDQALGPLVRAHRGAGADATIMLTRVEDPTRVGIVAFDEARRITRMVEKPLPDEVFSSWANAGVYVCGGAVLDYLPASGPQDFARDLFPVMLRDGRVLHAYPSEATVIDFGAPERLTEAALWVRGRTTRVAPC